MQGLMYVCIGRGGAERRGLSPTHVFTYRNFKHGAYFTLLEPHLGIIFAIGIVECIYIGAREMEKLVLGREPLRMPKETVQPTSGPFLQAITNQCQKMCT